MTRREWLWLAVLAAATLLRLVTLQAYPLNDTTEARYAEIGRQMVVTEDWVTPRLEAETPFWGKPPLSFWLTAMSFTLLGLTEFAARLPSFLLTLATAWLTFDFARRSVNRGAGIAAAAILMSSILGFVVAGAVMTDASLLLTTTISMVAFWMAVSEEQSTWRYLFFVALGLGLLAKGPVALIMAGVPVVGWLLLHRKPRELIRCLPWFSGGLLTLAIALPWYVLAELRTPGFLEYFLVGEHWLRFVDSGWQGDLYGEAHARPRGTIWLYAAAATLPWSVAAVILAVQRLRGNVPFAPTPLQAYLVLWVATPLVFFSFAGNILPTYVLTGLPAFAVLLAASLVKRSASAILAGWVVPLLACAVIALQPVLPVPERSQRGIVELQQSLDPESRLYYYPRKPHSADFYSRGRAALLGSKTEFDDFLTGPGRGFIAIRSSRLADLRTDDSRCLKRLSASARYVLFAKQSGSCKSKRP
jgi:4-amino-4-deoxy-L-arabinose transferase-like glycosyltransferase